MQTIQQKLVELSNIVKEVKLYRQIEKDLYKAIWEKDGGRKDVLRTKQRNQAEKLDNLLKEVR